MDHLHCVVDLFAVEYGRFNLDEPTTSVHGHLDFIDFENLPSGFRIEANKIVGSQHVWAGEFNRLESDVDSQIVAKSALPSILLIALVPRCGEQHAIA